MRNWTNEEAIRRWGTIPREVLESMEPDGDWAKRQLLNPVLLRMPAESLYAYAADKEAGDRRGIRYLRADLCRLPDVPGLGEPFEAVVASMVLMAIPDWAAAMRACAAVLAPGGLFVFAITHPCFEQLAPSWREHGEFRAREYFAEYEIPGPYASSPGRTRPTFTGRCRPTSTSWPGWAASSAR